MKDEKGHRLHILANLEGATFRCFIYTLVFILQTARNVFKTECIDFTKQSLLRIAQQSVFTARLQRLQQLRRLANKLFQIPRVLSTQCCRPWKLHRLHMPSLCRRTQSVEMLDAAIWQGQLLLMGGPVPAG